MEGYLVLVNPNSGARASGALEAALGALSDAARVEVVEPLTSDEIAAAVDGVGDRTVVVAGGDGTVHKVANSLAEHGILGDAPVGLVPLGTGNDFARLLGIPLHPAEAARAIIAGAPRRLDVLRTDRGELVVNAAHIGLGAEASAHAQDLKATLGAAAYPLGAAIAGASGPSWACEVTLDATTLASGEVAIVGIGNGRSVGGGSPLIPSAVPDDGLLDAVVVAERGLADRARMGMALRGGTHVELDGVHTGRGRVLVYEGEPAPVNLDGELVGERDRCSFEVLRGAWEVVAPADAHEPPVE